MTSASGACSAVLAWLERHGNTVPVEGVVLGDGHAALVDTRRASSGVALVPEPDGATTAWSIVLLVDGSPVPVSHDLGAFALDDDGIESMLVDAAMVLVDAAGHAHDGGAPQIARSLAGQAHALGLALGDPGVGRAVAALPSTAQP